MKLTRHLLIPAADLLAGLKQTRLMGFEQPCVYETARLSLEPAVDTDRLVPPQRYVLRPDVNTILAVHEALAARGVDIFALDGAVLFWVERDGEEEGPIPLTPPIVEMSREDDGREVMLINDGMHRVFAARSLGRPISIVLARDVPPQYPYYAKAVPGGWSGVSELDELPDGFIKKEYRNPDNYRALFRDFNAVFEGIQKRRKRSNPSHIRE
jgi:hypothetical protein